MRLADFILHNREEQLMLFFQGRGHLGHDLSVVP
jgi:hypothetical protein